MDSWTCYVLFCAFAIIVGKTARFFHKQIDPMEPPVLSPAFPILGHLFGMLRHGSYYYSLVR